MFFLTGVSLYMPQLTPAHTVQLNQLAGKAWQELLHAEATERNLAINWQFFCSPSKGCQVDYGFPFFAA